MAQLQIRIIQRSSQEAQGSYRSWTDPQLSEDNLQAGWVLVMDD